MTITKTAALFGCSTEQAKTQMQKNLTQLESMHTKALKTGAKVNGYTAENLQSLIAATRERWGL